MTTAEKIALEVAGENPSFSGEEFDDLDAALRAAGATVDKRGDFYGDPIRYALPDGSALTMAGDGWDLGYADCYCWQGAGHKDDCAARAATGHPMNPCGTCGHPRIGHEGEPCDITGCRCEGYVDIPVPAEGGAQ